MQEQLTMAGIGPLTCPHTGARVDDHVLCMERGTWVECQTSHWGEPPMCAYEEPDNSDEAKARRVKWIREHD